MSGNKYKCAVDGIVVVYGYKYHPRGISGVCPHIKCGSDSLCGAHGNKKCQHKSKLEQGANK